MITQEEARKILETPETVNGVTCYLDIVGTVCEDEVTYSFLGRPYSSEQPLLDWYAFNYWVFKDTGEIDWSDAPIPRKYWGKWGIKEHDSKIP